MPLQHKKCDECNAPLTPRADEIKEAWVHYAHCSKYEAPNIPGERHCCDSRAGMMHRWNCPTILHPPAPPKVAQGPEPPAASAITPPDAAQLEAYVEKKTAEIYAVKEAARGGVMYSCENAPPHDPVAAPSHYTRFRIQPFEAIADWGLNFYLGSAIKYISRNEAKGGVEDLRKAVQCLQFEIARREAADGRGK